METNDIPAHPISDWQPTTDKLTLALLGKLGEEVGELGSAICRCIIQGIDEVQPVTGKPNREWLEEEIADVLALAFTAINRLDLDHVAIERRRQRKTAYKEPWFASFETAAAIQPTNIDPNAGALERFMGNDRQRMRAAMKESGRG